MIVYVESNFVLELALDQEQGQAAQAILTLAAGGALRLVVPAFALSEPFATINYRGSEREKFIVAQAQQERDLDRSTLHKDVAAQLRLIRPILSEVRKTQMNALADVVARLLSVGEMAALGLSTYQQAREYEVVSSLSPQDAIIYATVVAHLQQQNPSEAKCFLSRDSKGFDQPALKTQLGQFNCRYISNFDDGLRYIQSNLASPAPA